MILGAERVREVEQECKQLLKERETLFASSMRGELAGMPVILYSCLLCTYWNRVVHVSVLSLVQTDVEWDNKFDRHKHDGEALERAMKLTQAHMGLRIAVRKGTYGQWVIELCVL